MGSRELEQESDSTSSVKHVVDASEEKLLSNGHTKGRIPPPDIVLESLPSQSTVSTALKLGLEDMAGTNLSDQEATANGGSKVKHGHSRTWQRNIHCLETEVQPPSYHDTCTNHSFISLVTTVIIMKSFKQ